MEAVFIILWLLCSVICYQIMKSKGYPNDTCLKHGIGGFFLGLIWVIVDLCKESYAAQQVQVAQQPVLNAPVESNGAATDNSMSLLEQLGKLAELKDNGVLTEAEFEAKKAEMLKKI